VGLFSLQVIFVCTNFIPPLFEDCGCFCFHWIVIEGFDLSFRIILFTALMIRVSPGAGIAHLYEFTRHIHTYKIVFTAVLFKESVYLLCRTRCDFRIFKTPVWKDFAFIRLDHQYALLTPANLIPFGMFAKIYICKILLVIKRTSQSGTIVKIVLTIVGRIRGSRHPACFSAHKAKNPAPSGTGFFLIDAWQFPTLTWGDPTLPSALRRFTSEFGMGSGGTTALKPPGKFC
ncbi:hypothetical protein AN2364V1_3201, partial [Enterobacter cloacae]